MNRKSYLAAYRAPNVSRFLTRFEQTRRNGLEQREDKRLGLLKEKAETSSISDLTSHPQPPTRKVHKISGFETTPAANQYWAIAFPTTPSGITQTCTRRFAITEDGVLRGDSHLASGAPTDHTTVLGVLPLGN
ncbi:MAG: hypothetical protein QOH70_2101 [Blastocatellia bacterium]|jgi:hypothetical protein|nr:hypothetical protein [Blastocatellia bacterium]